MTSETGFASRPDFPLFWGECGKRGMSCRGEGCSTPIVAASPKIVRLWIANRPETLTTVRRGLFNPPLSGASDGNLGFRHPVTNHHGGDMTIKIRLIGMLFVASLLLFPLLAKAQDDVLQVVVQ